MAQSEDKGAGPPVWRALFDAVERPVTRAAETWVQTDQFMDGLAVAWRMGRGIDRELRRTLTWWMGACGVVTRADVDRLSGELARVERELRALRREQERATASR